MFQRKFITKKLLIAASIGVAVFVMLQFSLPSANRAPLPNIQEVNQHFGVTFPAQSQVIDFEDYDGWGVFQVCAVVRMRRQDLGPFLAQPKLKACPPSEVAGAMVILQDAPQRLDNPSLWKINTIGRYQMILNVRDPALVDVKHLEDCQQLLIDLDDPKFATVYIEWAS